MEKYENDLVKSTTEKNLEKKIANWLNVKGLTLLWRKYFTTWSKYKKLYQKLFTSLVDAIKMVLFQFFNHSVNAASVQRTKQGFL